MTYHIGLIAILLTLGLSTGCGENAADPVTEDDAMQSDVSAVSDDEPGEQHAGDDAQAAPSDAGASEPARTGDDAQAAPSDVLVTEEATDDAIADAEGPIIEDTALDSPPGFSDMDGDGIPDEEDADMDGDGYSNEDELHAGTDPADPDSLIYIGGWPYNANKDAITDPGWDSEPLLGTVIPNYQAFDQHGDLVSLYDFAGTGKPIVIDVVTWTCDPCKAMADYFANGDPSVMDDFLFFADKYDVIRELIVNGDIHWITVIWSGGAIVDQSDAALWEETWPNPNITVLADSDLQLQSYLYVKAMPRIDVLDDTMTFVAFCDNDVPCNYELEGGGPGGPVGGLKWLEAHYDALYGGP